MIKHASSLKAHCKPGPKSPTRCNSATSAAIPPTFVPYDSAVAFHKSLKPRELANPQFRMAVGELATSLYTKNRENGLRSIAILENLCGLSQNESAVSYLRELAKSFGRSSEFSVSDSSISRKDALSNAFSTISSHAPPGLGAPAPQSSLHSVPRPEGSEDDSVRFSTSVQSKLFDSTQSPKSISAGKPRDPSRGRRNRDKPRDILSGGGAAKKSKSTKRGVPRSSAHSSKHLPGRAGNVSSVSVEETGSKSGTAPAVQAVVQLQPHTKNVDKVCRRSKKASGASKRIVSS
jgi:hypothetical protein